MGRLAFAVEVSQNEKVGLASCTYVSQVSTCPDSCPLKPKLDAKGKVTESRGAMRMVHLWPCILLDLTKRTGKTQEKQKGRKWKL